MVLTFYKIPWAKGDQPASHSDAIGSSSFWDDLSTDWSEKPQLWLFPQVVAFLKLCWILKEFM